MEAVGRIAAVLDAEHARHHGERCAFFGFFEAVDDPAVAVALFAEVERWAAAREAVRIRGPLNPNINEECGLLVEGYGMTETSPVSVGNPIAPTRRPGTVGVPFPSTDVRIVIPAEHEPELVRDWDPRATPGESFFPDRFPE